MAKRRKGSDIIPRKKLATRKKGNFKPRLELLHSIAKYTLYMYVYIIAARLFFAKFLSSSQD